MASDVLWQKNLFNLRYNVEQSDDIQSNKSAFDRLADMTEKSQRKRRKFPWFIILLFLCLFTFYIYDGNAVDGGGMIAVYDEATPIRVSEAQYLPAPQNVQFPKSYNNQ